jgi:chromosome segregation ATPase
MTIEQKIQAALQRLTHGRPEITNGQLTITNLCTEAGISRASFYRSPLAEQIKKLINDPASPRPELEDLRQQVKDLKNADKALRSQHASQIRELREQVTTYANQIQVLALHISRFQDDNDRLVRRLETAGDNVTPLSGRR